MRLLQLYRSVIGKKVIAAVTGAIMMGFLLLHVAGNLKAFLPDVGGAYRIEPKKRGVAQSPPLPVTVELGQDVASPPEGLADRIAAEIRAKLVVTTEVTLVPYGTLPREEYKAKLVDFSQAED